MKRFFSIFFFVIWTFLPTWSQERASLTSILPILESYVAQSIGEEGIPGVVVVIVKDGKIAYLKGFGVTIWGGNTPVDGHTPFALASLTKNFTNTLVARLVDQGKIQWKDKISTYLPDFELSDRKITKDFRIEDALSHRSGLPGFTGDTFVDLGWSASEIKSVLKEIPFEGEFRKTYEYQNVMEGFVGDVMEKVTGKPVAQLYEEELFQPLGLTETYVGKNTPLSPWEKILNLFCDAKAAPTLHDKYDGKTRFLVKGNPALYTIPASSGIVSTGHDIGQWLIFQLNKARVNGTALVSEANVNEMRTPRVEVVVQGGSQFPKNRIKKVQYGLGWFIHDYEGVETFSHMGGMEGTRSILLIIPEDNVGIAILSNFGGMRVSLFPEAIRNKFLDLYLTVKEDVDWAKKLRDGVRGRLAKYEKQQREEMLQHLAPARDLEDYAGVYENSLYGRVDIQAKENNLILTYRDRPALTLNHWNGNTFEFKGSDFSSGFAGTDPGEVSFSSEEGKSDQLMINLCNEGTDTVFRRVS